MAEMEEFLCLCLVLLREVKLSSSGFMSGGSFAIFRNRIARYMSMTAEIRCKPPVTMAVIHVVIRTMFVSLSVGNIVRQRPIVAAVSSELRRAMRMVKT